MLAKRLSTTEIDDLFASLDRGESMASIGRRLGVSPTTVAYWRDKRAGKARRRYGKYHLSNSELTALLVVGIDVFGISPPASEGSSGVATWSAGILARSIARRHFGKEEGS